MTIAGQLDAIHERLRDALDNPYADHVAARRQAQHDINALAGMPDPDPELERLMLDLNKHEHEVTVPTQYRSHTDQNGDVHINGVRITGWHEYAPPASITGLAEWLPERQIVMGTSRSAKVEQGVGRFIEEPPAPVDPLDVKHDGWTLRQLIEHNHKRRMEEFALGHHYTPGQKAALSAHWSAQLRAKVQATKAADAERERLRVVVDMEDD